MALRLLYLPFLLRLFQKRSAFSHAHAANVHSIAESMLVDCHKMCMNLQIHIRRAHIGTFLDKERWGQ